MTSPVQCERNQLPADAWPFRPCRLHIDAAALLVEQDPPSVSANSVQSRPVPTFCAGDEFGAALADQNAAGGDQLPAKFLDAEPLADAVAPIANAALTFFMCHKSSP